MTTNPTAPIERHESLAERPEAPGYKGEHCHEKKLRYVTMVADAPLTERENRRLSKDRTVLIFADNSSLIKAYQEEFKELGVKTHVFTTLKTRSKNTTIVNWESYEETEKQLKEYAAEDPNIQGIVYLLGATVKKFDKKVSPHNELTKYVMPLFIALRVFEKGLSNRTDADTFFAVILQIGVSISMSSSGISLVISYPIRREISLSSTRKSFEPVSFFLMVGQLVLLYIRVCYDVLK